MADPFAGLEVVEPADDPFAGLEAVDGADVPTSGAPLMYDVTSPVVRADEPPLPAPDEIAAQPRTSGLEAFGRGAAQGASMGFADEAAGLGGALYGPRTPRTEGRGTNAPPMHPLRARMQAYEAVRDAEQAANKQAAADTAFDKTGMNPVLAALTPNSVFGTGELFGGAATAAAPIGTAGRGLQTAQRIKAAAKTGAALGALAGFGYAEGGPLEQGVQTAAGGVGGAILGPLAAEGARFVGKGAGAASRAVRRHMDRLRGGPDAREITYGTPEFARKAEQLADPIAGKAQRAQASAGMDEQLVEQRARDVGSKIDELWQHGDVVKWEEDIASKGDLVKQLIARESIPAEGLAKAHNTYAAVRAEWDQLARDVGKGEGSSTIARLQREAFDAYENRLKKAADNFDPNDPSGYLAERFMALDDLKRQLQKEIARKRVPFDDLLRERMETPLRQSLEDAGTWGAGPATLQKVRNRGWMRRLQTQGRPEDAFLASRHFGDASADPYRVAAEHDVGKVLGIVRNAGKMEAEPDIRALTEWADREAELMEALTSHEGVDPALLARARRARELATEIQQAMGTRATEAQAADALKRAADAPPPPPGMIREAVESVPMVGPVVRRMRPMTEGARAHRMADLERVLRDNPHNKAARNELAGLTPGSTAESAGEAGGLYAGAPAVVRAEQFAPFRASVTARRSDDAQDDPRYGELLTSTPAGKKRDAMYATLIHKDAQFRARERERAQQQQEE